MGWSRVNHGLVLRKPDVSTAQCFNGVSASQWSANKVPRLAVLDEHKNKTRHVCLSGGQRVGNSDFLLDPVKRWTARVCENPLFANSVWTKKLHHSKTDDRRCMSTLVRWCKNASDRIATNSSAASASNAVVSVPQCSPYTKVTLWTVRSSTNS